MLKYMRLKNFVLIEETEVVFDEGLNIITGETGAGKSLILDAIQISLGQKPSPHTVRTGADKAYVEIAFLLDKLPHLYQTLQDAGIEYSENGYLIIKREIPKDGRPRSFINSSMVPVHFLQKIADDLFELVSQHATIKLFKEDYQRSLIDLLGKIDLSQLKKLFQKKQEIEKELIKLRNDERENLEFYQWQLQEILDLDLKQNEEIELVTEHEKITKQFDNIQTIQKIIDPLDNTVLPELAEIKKQITLIASDKDTTSSKLHLDISLEKFKETSLFLNEVSYQLNREIESTDLNESEIISMEERLSKIDKLKRKHGDLFTAKTTLENKIFHLENQEEQIHSLEEKLVLVNSDIEKEADSVSKKRQDFAIELEISLTNELRFLNMQESKLFINFSKKETNSNGKDRIEFRLQANKGEPPASIKKESSGGEISRLMFAIKLVLAEKEHLPTLILDEIDSGVGGETATKIGEKLATLGSFRQIFCITHFPQVASFAKNHLRVSKKEANNRTITEIASLKEKEKSDELLRMLGGKKLNLTQ